MESVDGEDLLYLHPYVFPYAHVPVFPSTVTGIPYVKALLFRGAEGNCI